MAAAIQAGESLPVIEATAFAVKNHDPKKMPLVSDVFIPAVKFLTQKKDARWVHGSWYMPEVKVFFESMSAANASLILDSMSYAQKIDSQEERFLRCLSVNNPELVLAFFKRRLDGKKDEDANYEAIPFQFYDLNKELVKNPDLLITTLRKWYRKGDYMFEHTGGRFLHSIFPGFTAELGQSLIKVISNGSEDDFDFALALLQNYRGEPATHEVIKELIHRLPPRSKRLSKIDICLGNTGVVSGQFGFVEAYRGKIAELSPWRDDTRPKVKAYADKYIRQLTQSIASAQRSAEMDTEIRKRDYDVEDEKA